MQNNFIDSKQEKELVLREHQEQRLGCIWGVPLLVCKGREGEKPTGPTRLALGGADRKGIEENKESMRRKIKAEAPHKVSQYCVVLPAPGSEILEALARGCCQQI